MPALTTVTRSITVAAGLFAPGHLGELTRIIPFELVDAVLAETGRVQQRLRLLPSRVGVYLVLAMGLFDRVGLRGVFDRLTAGLTGLVAVAAPSEKALRDLRRRLGPEPFKALFEVLAGPLAQPGTPGTRYRRWRTVAFDGCSSTRVPDQERNRSWLGTIMHPHGPAAYPTLMLMALVETGTRGLLGAVLGPLDRGEREYAGQLSGLLGPDHLVLHDRGMDGAGFLRTLTATGAQVLGRWQIDRALPILAVLPDGSYLTRLEGIRLRVILAQVTLSLSDGSTVTGRWRLVTTLTDHHTDPAHRLVTLYHERWEIESAFYALRHTLLHQRVLRSGDPTGLRQELWALLTVYQALRTAILDAAEHRPGTDPDRLSFTLALETARDSILTVTGLDPQQPSRITALLLHRPLPDRRPRISDRKVKAPTSRYHKTNPHRPATSTTITHIHTSVQPPPPDPASNWTPLTHRAPAVLTLLNSDPTRAWTIPELAHTLHDPHPVTLGQLLANWSRKKRVHRVKRGVYSATNPLTNNPSP